MSKLKKILLIEDDDDIRSSYLQALENSVHKIYSVSNGWDALVLLEQIDLPELIILDLSMPIMSGEEFLKLKNENPKLIKIPVLVVSSHQHRLDILKEYPSLKKPVDIEDFTAKVLECLN